MSERASTRRRSTRRGLKTALGIGGIGALVLAGTAAATTTSWTLQHTIPYPGAGILAAFGNAVALSPDGNTAVVGAPAQGNDKGSVVFYSRLDDKWIQRETIPDPEGAIRAKFGSSVAVSTNGQTALVGTDGAGPGFVAIYARTGATWALQQLIPNPGHAGAFGGSVALSSSGSTVAVGAFGAQEVWIYTRSSATWSLQQTISVPATTPGGFGQAVALSANGSTLLVGAPSAMGGSADTYEPAGAAWIFARHAATWTQQGPSIPGRTPGGNFGWAVALSPDGTIAAVGTPAVDRNMGSVTIAIRHGEVWSRAQTLLEPGQPDQVSGYGDAFGTSVAAASAGHTIVVGAPLRHRWARGAVVTFARTGSKWVRTHTISGPGTGSTDIFGTAVAGSADATTLMVGAPGALRGNGSVSIYTVPALAVRWTVARDFVTALIRPRAGAVRYSLTATSPGGTRTGVCNLIGTGTHKRARCTRSLPCGIWTLTAQAHSTTSVIAQAIHSVLVH